MISVRRWLRVCTCIRKGEPKSIQDILTASSKIGKDTVTKPLGTSTNKTGWILPSCANPTKILSISVFVGRIAGKHNFECWNDPFLVRHRSEHIFLHLRPIDFHHGCLLLHYRGVAPGPAGGPWSAGHLRRERWGMQDFSCWWETNHLEQHFALNDRPASPGK